MEKRHIEQYEQVTLTDGRKGCVVEILGDQDIFLIDIGASEGEWDTIEVRRNEIEG